MSELHPIFAEITNAWKGESEAMKKLTYEQARIDIEEIRREKARIKAERKACQPPILRGGDFFVPSGKKKNTTGRG
jgi:hypothetical protein